MRRIDHAQVFPHPAGLLDDAVREVLPQCGAKIDGRRAEGEVSVITAHASVHLGSGGQYITCRVEPLPNNVSRLHVESTFWQVEAEEATHVVDRLFSETERWFETKSQAAEAAEPVAIMCAETVRGLRSGGSLG